MSEDNLGEFLRQENERLQAEQAQRIKETGGVPFLGTLPVGQTTLTLLKKVPKHLEPKPSDQYQTVRKGFFVTEGNVIALLKKGAKTDEKMWTVNVNSPTYRDVIEMLAKAPIAVNVVKTGSGKQTRYDVVPAK